MAIVTRYFSTTSAGAGDGTTWADRAALFSAGNWSTVITAFNFSGADSLTCLIEGNLSYTCSQSLATGLFSNAPSVANPLTLHGCDSSGTLLSPPDADWTSDLPAWATTTLPVIATTTNIATVGSGNFRLRLIAFTASGRNAEVITGISADWCSVINSTSNTNAVATACAKTSNCVVSCTGSSFNIVVQAQNSQTIFNTKVVGVLGSSGNRHGISYVGTNQICSIVKSCVISCGGVGIISSSTNVSQTLSINQCVVANNGSDGIRMASTASQLILSTLTNNMVTGNGGYGINANGARVAISQNRLRDNTSGNFNGFDNYPTDMDNYIVDSDDASEYIDTAVNNYQIQADATIATMGFGISVECAGSASQTSFTFVA